MGFMAKLKQTLSGNKDKANQGIDKAADVVDSKTGGKYSDKIDTGADKAKDAVNKLAE